MKKCIIALSITLLSLGIYAQKISNKIKGIPYEMEVINSPVTYSISESDISISSPGKTNLFNSPSGTTPLQNAPLLLFEPATDFTLKAKVSGNLAAVYDVAALVVYKDKDTWAKLCYENSVEKIPTVVSVVTRTFSDDCNSVSTGDYAYLSIVKKGDEFSFFYSADGDKWKMIRNFHLDTGGKVKLGFASHGSRGNGFTANFSEIKYIDKAMEDMRDM